MAEERILLADPYEIVRIGIVSTLSEHRHFKICGEVSDGRSMVEKTLRLEPDLVIMDIVLPSLNGIEAARQILAKSPHALFLVFTSCESEQVMLDTLRLGVTGFVSKADRTCDLVTAIEAVIQGRTFFTSRMTAMLQKLAKRKTYDDELTGREREILQLIAEGHSTKNIAHMLAISIKTLETHRNRINRKLEIHSKAQLIQYAVRNHIINIGQPDANTVPWSASLVETPSRVGEGPASDRSALCKAG